MVLYPSAMRSKFILQFGISFKYLPYRLKQFSEIETLDFEACRVTNSGDAAYDAHNKSNYDYITENSVLEKQSQNYFHFLHCEGAHIPFHLDKNFNYVRDGTYEQEIAASLTVIKAYIQRLKDNDSYDNSVIVIMSDHAYYDDQYETPYLYLSRCNPILCIKGVNEDHEMLISDRSVSYIDLVDAFCDLLDGRQSTELFAEFEPGRTRTTLWQIYGQEYHMVEYETTGKAWEIDKFIPTGNIYDLKE